MRKRLPDPVDEERRNPELPLARPRKITLVTCGVCGERRPNKGRGLCAEHYLAEYKAGRIHQWKLDRSAMAGVRANDPAPDTRAWVREDLKLLTHELLMLSARLAEIAARMAAETRG